MNWWRTFFGLNAGVQGICGVTLLAHHAPWLLIEVHFCEFAVWTVGLAILSELSKWRKL